MRYRRYRRRSDRARPHLYTLSLLFSICCRVLTLVRKASWEVPNWKGPWWLSRHSRPVLMNLSTARKLAEICSRVSSCVGSKNRPGAFYFLLDARAVGLGECGTVRAVDCLFKAHYVFWVDYAKCLSSYMEFLQKVLYKIEVSKLSARVRELCSSIRALTAESD